MACESSRLVAHAYLDGEVDAVRSAEFESHLETCADCLAVVDSWQPVRSGMQEAGLREPAPPALRAKILASLPHNASCTPAARPISTMPSKPRPYAAWFAIAAAILLALVLTLRILPEKTPAGATPELAAQLVDAHLRSLQPGHLMDVVSTDQHTVKPWFNGKLDFSPTVTDFADHDFPLEGGRLDVAGGRTVAALIYGRRKHLISVFIWPDSQNSDSAPRSGSVNGYQWIGWRKSGMNYYAVSDVNAADLALLQSLLAK